MFQGNLSVPSRVKQFKKKDYLPLEDGAGCSEMSVNYPPINAAYHHRRAKILDDLLTCRSIVAFNKLTLTKTALQSFKMVVNYLPPVMV
jgi:hypothetical protein